MDERRGTLRTRTALELLAEYMASKPARQFGMYLLKSTEGDSRETVCGKRR